MSDKKFNDTERYYSWSLVTYSTPLEFGKLFERVNHYAYIKHDKEKAVEHYHVLLTFKKEISLKKIKDIISSSSNTLGQPLKDRFAMFSYLTHENLSESEKEVYNKDDIVCDNKKYWLSVETSKADNREFVKDLLTLSQLNLAIKYGKDFIRNRCYYISFAREILCTELKEDLDEILND